MKIWMKARGQGFVHTSGFCMHFVKIKNASIDSGPHYPFRNVFDCPVKRPKTLIRSQCDVNQQCTHVQLVLSANFWSTKPISCELGPSTPKIKRVILKRVNVEQLFAFGIKSCKSNEM